MQMTSSAISDGATASQASRKARVFALSIGSALAKMLGVITAAVMARVLIKDDVAAYRQTFLAYATLGPLLTMGVGQGMYYFLPTEKERVRGRMVDGMLVLGLLGLVFSAFLAFGGNDLLAQRFSNPRVARMLLWMIPYAIITTPTSIYSSVLVARDHVTMSSVLGVTRQFVAGVITIVPLLVWQTAESALIGNVLASVLMAVAAISLTLRVLPKGAMLPTWTGVKELLIFGIPLGLSSSIGTLNQQLDKMVVGFLDTPSNFADFSFGAMELPFIGMVTGAVTSVLLIDMRKAVSNGDNKEALRLFRLTSEKTSLVLIPLFFFFLVCADDFVTFVYTSEYAAAATPFRWYLMVLPIRTAFFGSLLMAMGMSRFLMVRSIVSLTLNCCLSVMFFRWLGAYGAAVSTVIVKYIWAVPISLYMLSKGLGCRWWEILPLGHLGLVALQMLPVALVAYLASQSIENSLFSLLMTSTIFAVFLAYWWHDRIYTIEQLRRLLPRR